MATTDWQEARENLSQWQGEKPGYFKQVIGTKRVLLRQGNGHSRIIAGCAAELLVCADLVDQGYAVYRAVSSNAPCDLVAIKAGKIIRVEVKVGEAIDRVQIRNHGEFDQVALVSRKAGISFHLQENVPRAQRVGPRAH